VEQNKTTLCRAVFSSLIDSSRQEIWQPSSTSLAHKWKGRRRIIEGPRHWISKLGLGPLGQPICTNPAAQLSPGILRSLIVVLEVVGWCVGGAELTRSLAVASLPRFFFLFSFPPAPARGIKTRQLQVGHRPPIVASTEEGTHWAAWWRTGHDASPSARKGQLLD